MAEMRTRDRVWNVTLVKTVLEDNAVTITEIVESTGVSERTVREVLNAMSSTPFLDRSLAGDGTVRFTSELEWYNE